MCAYGSPSWGYQTSNKETKTRKEQKNMKDQSETSLLAWPGKSRKRESDPRHPAAYHMLDVMAVAEILAKDWALEARLKKAFVLLVGLHDLGKLTPEFRAMLEEGADAPVWCHWETSEAILYALDDILAEYLPGKQQAREELYAAVAGHHGRPSQKDKKADVDRMAKKLCGSLTLADSRYFLLELIDLLGVEPCDPMPKAIPAKLLSWLLAGQASVADWIGSNTDWFKPKDPNWTIAEYWEIARKKARIAVEQAGLEKGRALDGCILDFDQFHPMQQVCKEIEISEGPTLVLIEDETGTGKTEAALLTAQRMILAGKGDGLYFGLPTMATANSMFSRCVATVGRMIDNPSLVLAHGKSKLSEQFRSVAAGEARQLGYDVSSTAWLADDRRKALLAQVGVGTIDQVLSAVMPAKHTTMRHWGLLGKILVVDEVHEMGDPYMMVALRKVLAMHASCGGSAILMTATLPVRQKRELIEAFTGKDNLLPSEKENFYPCLTVISRDQADAREVATVDCGRPDVLVQRIKAPEAAVNLIAEKSRAGSACVWIRNSVDDAIAAVEDLRRSGIDADLLHARFALCDRKRIEDALVARLGKSGSDDTRRGYVLVATQVVESSLDLDFDVMVSDLAPMAAIIQRAGRLWRHMAERPADARPVDVPILYLVSPDPDIVTGPDWLPETIGTGGYTYSRLDTWRTADTLLKVGRISVSHGLRDLINPVHGDDPIDAPDVLATADQPRNNEDKNKEVSGYHNTWSARILILSPDPIGCPRQLEPVVTLTLV
ncbi:CRISPR-associated helicase Cas3' [Candidatus Poribacteria bacterium]|nr:CRISPR-associated helicase Cas3' [Candidatus Poribacteria bacterium]